MKALICPNCSANAVLNKRKMMAKCPYCDTEFPVTAEDIGFVEPVTKVLSTIFCNEDASFLQEKLDLMNQEEYWVKNEQFTEYHANSQTIRLSYIYAADNKDVTMYMGRKVVALKFRDKAQAKRYVDNTKSIKFPEADTRNLGQYLPSISNIFDVEEGGTLVIIERGLREYPLSSFMPLEDVHAAWVTSRLENLMCVLQYNYYCIDDFSVEDFYIDPSEHQVYFYGGLDRLKKVKYEDDFKPELLRLREVVTDLMGAGSVEGLKGKIPEAYVDFLEKNPQADAYKDFAAWDATIMLAFGKREFKKIGVDDSKLS